MHTCAMQAVVTKQLAGRNQHFQKAVQTNWKCTPATRFNRLQHWPASLCQPAISALCCVTSSLYYDEDGDLAHEFYEETVVTKNGRKKSKLKRIQKNLIPQVREGCVCVCVCVCVVTSAESVCFILQGIVKLEHPCIHVDFPMILCEG